MNFCKPLAIVRISPPPISTFSLYKFSLFGFFSTQTIFPTLKSHLDNSCKSSFLASGFFYCFYPFYCYCFSFFGLSEICFSACSFSPYFYSSYFSGFPYFFSPPSFFSPPYFFSPPSFFSTTGPPAFFSSFLAFAALIFSNFFNWALEGSDWLSSGKVTKRPND